MIIIHLRVRSSYLCVCPPCHFITGFSPHVSYAFGLTGILLSFWAGPDSSWLKTSIFERSKKPAAYAFNLVVRQIKTRIIPLISL